MKDGNFDTFSENCEVNHAQYGDGKVSKRWSDEIHVLFKRDRRIRKFTVFGCDIGTHTVVLTKINCTRRFYV